MSASLALLVAYRHLAAFGESYASIAAVPMSSTAMPLLVFLLAYVAGGSSSVTSGLKTAATAKASRPS